MGRYCSLYGVNTLVWDLTLKATPFATMFFYFLSAVLLPFSPLYLLLCEAVFFPEVTAILEAESSL